MAKNDIDELMSVGVDIGKDVFHLVGFDHDGQLVLRKKIKRMALVATFKKLPRCIVGMEPCLSAHLSAGLCASWDLKRRSFRRFT